MKTTVNKIIICLTILLFIGCAAHVHTVGSGPQSGSVDSARQYYIMMLVPLNEVDTNAMAGGNGNYEIKTDLGFVDILIQSFTGGFVTSRTVTLTK